MEYLVLLHYYDSAVVLFTTDKSRMLTASSYKMWFLEQKIDNSITMVYWG